MTIYLCIVSIIYVRVILKYEKEFENREEEFDGSSYYNITLQNDIDLRKIFEARISIVFWSFSSYFSSYFLDWKSRKQLTKNVGRRFRWRRWSFIFRSWMENKVRASRNGILAERLRSYVTRWIRYCEFSSSKLLRWKW